MLRQRSWLLSVLLLSLCGWLGGAVASAQTIQFVNASGASTATVLEKSRAQVWITDPGLNFYSSVPDLVGVTFTSAATGDQDQVVFYETGPSTGVFIGGIDLISGPASFDGLLATDTGPPPASTLDTIEARYYRPGTGYQSVTATVVPSATTLIDELGREPSSVAVFHKVHVRVEDHNTDSPLEIGTVTVQMTTISGDLETLVLKETGAATQIYEGSIESNTGPTFAVPGDGAVQLIPQAGDGVTATHLDLNGSTQSSDSATAATAYLTFIDENGRPVTSLLENSKAYLRLYDWFTNGSPTSRDYATVQVSAGVSGDQEWVGLYETAPDSHVFEGAVQLGSGPAYTDGIVTTSRIAGPPVEFDTLTASYPSYEGPYLNVIAGLTGASEISFLDEFGRSDEFVPIGSDLRIQVRDPSIRRSDRATVTVTSTGSGDSETVTLLRVHGGSDVFEGRIRLSDGWAESNNRALEATAGDTIVAVHPDANGLTSSTASTRAASLEIQMLDTAGRPADPLLEYGPVRVRLFDRGNISYQSDLNLFSLLLSDYERVSLSAPPVDGISEGTVQLMPGSYSYGDGKLGVASTRLTPPTRSDTVKAEIMCYSPSLCPPTRAQVTGGILTFLNSLGHPVEAFAPGEPITIRLEKYSENLPTVIDQAEVTVRAVPNGSTLSVTLTETGVNTGLFQGSLLTADADGPPTTGKLRMRVGETVGATWEFPPGVFVATDTARVQAATFELLDENGEPLESILAGRPITIRVFNPAENTSPSYPNALPAEFITLQGSLGQLDRELVGADETGPDTSLFIGTAQTRFDYPSSMDGTVQILSGATWGDGSFDPVRLDVTVGDAHARFETRASVTRLINAQGNDVERIGLGSPLYLQVEFHGAGDPGNPDQVQAWVWSETTDDFENVILTETGADTGIFEGSIPSVQASSPQNDGTLQAGAGPVWAAHFSPNSGHLYSIDSGVAALNQPPVAAPDSVTFDEDSVTSITLDVLANDYDPEGQPLQVTGISAPSGYGTFTLNLNGSITYEPTPNQYYTIQVEYTVTDGISSATGMAYFEINPIPDPPTAVPDTVTVLEGGQVQISVLDNDQVGDTLGLAVGAVTNSSHGNAVNLGNIWVVWTATDPDYSGIDTFTYVLEGGDGLTAIGTVTVIIEPVDDGFIAFDDAASMPEDSAVTVNVLANDIDVDSPKSVTAVTQPAHGTAVINPDFSITYTPAANYTGTDSFTYTGAGSPNDDQGLVTITINPVNDTPDAVNDSATTEEDAAATVTVLSNDTDPENDSLTITAVTQGAHGTVTFTANSITFTPAANYNGPDSFTYTISDGNGASDTATVNVTITAANDAPDAVSDSTTTAEDTAATITVLANDTDPENDSLAITGVTQGSKGSVTFAAGSVMYTPAANANGADSFTYTISDGNGGTATGTVSITISPVNDAPDATNDAASTLEDTAVVIPVLANDLDVDGESLQVLAVTQGTSGAVTINGNGTLTYTPNLNTNGADSFTYTVRDAAGATDTATVSLAITPVNDPPVAVADAGTTRENTAVTVTVLPNDSDIEGNTLAVTVVATPAFGTAVGNPGNSITYTPSANFNGTDTFTYTVSDGQGGSATATVTITVKDALERVAVLGTNSVYLQTGSDVLSGDVIVNQSGTGPFLNGGVELSIAGTVTTPAGYDITGNRINLASGAVINGDAFYNTLTGTGSINGGQTSSLTLPVFSPLPAFQSATPGTTNVNVGNNGNRTLAAGSYLDLVVGRKGTVTFTGGTYHFRSIQISREARLIFNAASQIRVQQKLSTATLATIGPATGASFDASSLIFYVGGANGTTGGLAETPKAVEIGTDNVLKANVYAPNGTLWLRDRTQATGAFLAKDVQAGADVQVTLDSFYVGQ